MKKFQFHIVFYLTVVLIGAIDFFAGGKLSLKVALFIPMYFYTNSYRTSKIQCYTLGVVISIIWSYLYLRDVEYQSLFFLIVNFFIRTSVFLIFIYLLYTIKTQRYRLNKMNEELRVLNEEKNKVLGVAAHDLRSPIAKIFQTADLLTDASVSVPLQKQKRFLEIIKSTCTYMLSLLDKTLDLSKIESGQLVLKKQEVNYIDFIKDAISNNISFAEKKGIQIVLDTYVKEVLVHIDPEYINQVVDNLLSNSIKYSYTNTKIVIRVSTSGDQIVTEVIDEGVGIREDDLERIFLPFQTSDSEPTDGETSTGLGLAIVKRIVDEHQGKIEIRSQKKRGTTVIFELPLS